MLDWMTGKSSSGELGKPNRPMLRPDGKPRTKLAATKKVATSKPPARPRKA